MPFARPLLSALVDRIRGDLRGRLEVDGTLVRRAMADVIAAVLGGAVHGLYGLIEWLSRQVFADKAEREWLLRKAALFGITLEPAQFATGTANATGTNGTVIPAGTVLVLDSVTEYTTTSDQTINVGSPPVNATLPLLASLAGTAANVPSGTQLTLKSPIPGVNSVVTVTADITNGADEEDIEHLRARFLQFLRKPPEGGADQDYEAWALAATGTVTPVTRAWVYPNENGPGTVVVRFAMDTGYIFPEPADVAAVQAKLDAERPITATVTAAAPTELDVLFTIHVVPDTTATRNAVAAELDDLFKREAEAGDGAGRGTVLLSQMRTAIGNAEGVTDYTLTLPAANVVPALGELPSRSTITWA